MHVYAVSAAINLPIWSYCPANMCFDHVNHPYNVAVCGRAVRSTGSTAINLMWTMMHVPLSIQHLKPNHVVFLARKSFGTTEVVNCEDDAETDIENESQAECKKGATEWLS